MFRLTVKVSCVSFLAFAGVAWSCGLSPVECSARAAEAAGVLGVATLLGLSVARRVAAKVFDGIDNDSSGPEPPVDESRGTDQPTP